MNDLSYAFTVLIHMYLSKDEKGSMKINTR